MLFVCETDAQLFNAINIKLNIFPMKDADVCIADTAKNREKISNRIKQYGIFKNVYRMLAHRDTKQTFTAKLRKALSYISQTKLWENIPNKEMNYSDIFIAGPSMNCIKVYYYFRKINPDIKLHLYEEGVFEYYMFAYKQNPVRRLYSKVIFGCYYLDNASDIYVYSENMMLKKPDNVELKVIPMVSKNNEDLRRIENAVFDFSYEGLETFGECRFLFLEQFFPNQKEQEAQMNIIRLIAECVGKKKLLVKIHPYSDTQQYITNGIKYIKSNYSMELLTLNFHIDDITVFTICSSAVLNMNLIFGNKPKIFFLYKLFDSKTVDDNLEKVIEKFAECYCKDLISIPATQEQFYEVINEGCV